MIEIMCLYWVTTHETLKVVTKLVKTTTHFFDPAVISEYKGQSSYFVSLVTFSYILVTFMARNDSYTVCLHIQVKFFGLHLCNVKDQLQVTDKLLKLKA